jgi:ATP-dependent protease Clp ATPase subunit
MASVKNTIQVDILQSSHLVFIMYSPKNVLVKQSQECHDL